MPAHARVTLRDVARLAQVSKTTASYVLSETPGFQVQESTRRRVFAAAERLGYRRNALAAALSSGRIHAVGVVLFDLVSRRENLPGRTYAKDITLPIVEAAAAAGLRATLLPVTSPEPESVSEFADQRVDGVILVSFREEAFVRAVYATGVPCVEINSAFGDRSVHADNAGGMEAAVAHLAALGHRRIVHWRGEPGRVTAERRAQGFSDALRRHDLTPADRQIVWDADALRAFLAQDAGERPTAVVCFNDVLASNVLDIARERGLRVPEALSVIGFDDSILAVAARPRLTTIHMPLAELADAAIGVLQSLWRGEEEPPLPPPLPVRLVVRESTGPVTGPAA
jgi:LacI family transcriptional regulator